MKKQLLLFCLFVLCCDICMSQERNVVDKALLQSLEENAGELTSVNIVMKSQVASERLMASRSRAKSREDGRNMVVRELKLHSADTQEGVLSILRNAESEGNVTDIVTHWISNSISCRVSKEVIRRLSSHPDVLLIGQDRELQIIESCAVYDASQLFAANKHSATPHVLQVNADDVWRLGYTGKNVVVAILDSGTNPDHYDLKDHLWTGYADTDGDGEEDEPIHGWNFVEKNADITDDFGHGTHCAGIVCGDGTIGNVTGVAPDATLMTVKVVNRTGGGTPAQMMSGVEFAVENGADVLSMSLGFKRNQIRDADIVMLRRTFENTLSMGVAVCAAAGNDGNSYGAPDNVDYPAACPPPYLHPDQQANSGGLTSVICVGSVNANDEYVSSSSQGPSTWQGTEFGDYPYDDEHIGLIRPDIAAPGDLVYSLKHDVPDKYKYMSGTSQATPCVAGVIALMLEKNPTLTPAQICETIETTAKKLSASKNNYTGSGRIDALAAVNSVEATNERPYIKLVDYSPSLMSTGGSKDIAFTVANTGKGASNGNVSVRLSTADPYVKIENGVADFGALPSGGSASGVFVINTTADIPNGHTAYMTVTTIAGAYEWSDEVVVVFDNYARIVCRSSWPESLKPGKNVAINVNMVNEGTASTIGETKVTMKCSSPYVTMVNDEAVLGVMAAGEECEVQFVVDIDESAPDNISISFDVYATPDNFTAVNSFVYEFESGLDADGYVKDGFCGWTTFDASNDGRDHAWWHSSVAGTHKAGDVGEAHSGFGQMMSETYCQASMMVYSMPIDNYLVSPKVRVAAGGKFSFWARIHSSIWFGEHFGIAVSESGNKSADDFETVAEWSITKADGDGWREYTFDLSAYEGKNVYVAIRHFFTDEQWAALDYGYDVYILHIDDVMFQNVVDVSTDVVNDNYSRFSLVVEGNPLPAPSNVTATAIDAKSVKLAWSAVTNAQRYNIYRNGAYLANTTGSSYIDSGLDADTEYSYSIAAVYNNKEYERSEAVTTVTGKVDYSVKIKSVSADVLETGENSFDITVVNNGKYEQKSKSTLTLTTTSPYVTVVTGNVGMNYLPVGAEAKKNFKVVVNEAAPNGYVAEFNLNVTELYEDKNVWNLSFSMVVNNAVLQDIISEAKSLIDGWGVGYPNEVAKNEYIAALDAARNYSDVEAAKAVLYAADVEMPADAHSYYIKAKYNDGSCRYLYDTGTGLGLYPEKDERPDGYSGVFVFRALGDGCYALVNNNGKYMVYYADGKCGAGEIENGFADSYELGAHDAEIRFVQGTRVVPTNPGTLDVGTEFFGGFVMQAFNGSDDAMYYMMAGDADFHSAGPNSIYYQDGNRSSLFYLEEANYPNSVKLNDISSSTLISGFARNGLSTFSAPFPVLLPDGVTAYYAKDSGWDNGCVSLVAYEGNVIPACEGFILSGNKGTYLMCPAAAEEAMSVEDNILGNTAGKEKELVSGECYILGNGRGGPGLYACSAGTLGMNKAYLNVSANGSRSARILFPGSTGIDGVKESDATVVFDLYGRRVEKPVRGIYVVNGKKVCIK